jgi:hypothetical protein
MEIQRFKISNSSTIINDFIKDFAACKELDPATIISIKVEADGTALYEYADLKVGGVHIVQDFKRV